MPFANVMQTLYDNRETPEDLDINQLISQLADSLNFTGSANIQLVKARKEVIKTDLPKNMQGLCRDEDEPSPNLLFGDDLNSKIKEVSELNRISTKFTPAATGARNSSRGRTYNRGRRFFRNRFTKKSSFGQRNQPKNGAAGSKPSPGKAQ